MRLGIRGKQIAGVTTLVALVVVALSVAYVATLADIVLQESRARGELLMRAILDRARELVIANEDPYPALRDDPGLRALLQSSYYGESVTGAAILDTSDVVLAHSDPEVIGKSLPGATALGEVVESSTFDQLGVIYDADGRTLELREPLQVGNEQFGAVRVEVSTLLMRSNLNDSLETAIFIGVGALAIAVVVAAFLSQLFLRPIHVLRGGLTRLGKGEFVTLDLPPGDEFGELGSFFNTVSQQLSADRTLLAGQKANLQSAVEHLEDAVALFNPSGHLLFSNPAMEPTLPADAIGRALQGLLPDGHPYRMLVEETLATRTARGPMQAREGELLMTHAVQGTDGELVGVLLVSRNQAYLARMQSTLAYSRKLVALGRLTAGIAHEVKNPLNAMMIHLELLRTKIRSGALAVPRETEPVAAAARSLSIVPVSRPQVLPPAVQGALEHVEIIESEIRRLDEVVQGFLKFTRPDELRLQPVSIASIVEEILPVVAPEAQKNNVRVLTECAHSAPRVNGDAGMLRQVFLNLAINGCQAMANGGTLRITCAATSRSRVEVRVEDTGVGIPPESLGRIFDLYFTTKDHGTGIGLSMVYRIVQMHDGEVEVQSTPGRGTTFRVLLPRANEV
jgi:signal transduction histidine kinase